MNKIAQKSQEMKSSPGDSHIPLSHLKINFPTMTQKSYSEVFFSKGKSYGAQDERKLIKCD